MDRKARKTHRIGSIKKGRTREGFQSTMVKERGDPGRWRGRALAVSPACNGNERGVKKIKEGLRDQKGDKKGKIIVDN